MANMLHHWINGQKVKAANGNLGQIFNPATGEVASQVPFASTKQVGDAIASAQAALPAWSATPPIQRARVMFRFKALLEENIDEIATLVSSEHGKILDDARGSTTRGLEVVEFACGIPHLLKGEFTEQVGTNVDSYSIRQPVGVCVGITPFNFPAMVPLWMIPLAITTGNCFILKPSEQTPLSAFKIAEYLKEAGLPDGVFNIVNGAREAVEAICDHPDIKAVAFVGSSNVAKIVYSRSAANGKRAICLGGAKNHMIVVPDADQDSTAKGLLASSMGSAGQRCMAASVAVGVADVDHIIEQLVEEAKKYKLGIDMGTIISRASFDRINNYIDEAEKMGAKILIDGRNSTAPDGYENGYWLGATILDNVDPDWPSATDEIFGPVLSIIRTDNLEDALKIENGNQYGNAAAVFTTSGQVAKTISESASAGMIGINIGVPVPREPFSFGGWNESKYGHGDITGKSGVDFWTNLKKVTSRWPESNESWKKYF